MLLFCLSVESWIVIVALYKNNILKVQSNLSGHAQNNYMRCLLSLLCVLKLCGAFIVAFGEFQMIHSKFSTLSTTFWPIYPANTLVVTGTIATCVCYLGVLGGMRENRCMLISVSMKHDI